MCVNNVVIVLCFFIFSEFWGFSFIKLLNIMFNIMYVHIL